MRRWTEEEFSAFVLVALLFLFCALTFALAYREATR